jgi:hypothetical protein
VAAVALALTLPGGLRAVELLRETAPEPGSGYVLDPGEMDALRFLEDAPREGGVLSRPALGQAVPAFTGRRTYVGHTAWTPDFGSRALRTERLFRGSMRAGEARSFVRSTGVPYLLADCGSRQRLDAVLGARLVARTTGFGCARVYEISPPP